MATRILSIEAGTVFERWTVVAEAGQDKSRNALVTVKCVCGTVRNVPGFTLRNATSKSCGCLQREVAASRTTHGKCKTPEYTVWRGMWDRCTNKNTAQYAEYCYRTPPDSWKSFPQFLTDMGPRPSAAHTLERRDNSKGYSAENCCWATRAEQSRNSTRNRWYTFRGVAYVLKDLAAHLDVPYSTLKYRLEVQGFSVEDVLEQKQANKLKESE